MIKSLTVFQHQSLSFFFYSFLFILSTAVTAQERALEKGVVIDRVLCQNNSEQSFALYLPEFYDPQKEWPVIFIFDPMARGSLALKSFKHTADTYGVILAASNNSKNGSWNIILNAAAAMIEDVAHRFPLNRDRVYASGFSGGSRAASALASLNKDYFSGVIACGAGLAAEEQYKPQPGMSWSYVALVGNLDMNFQELHEVKKHLNELKISNHLITFNRYHQWPDSLHIQEAYAWLELEAFKKKKSEKDQAFVAEQYNQRMNAAERHPDPENILERLRLYEKIQLDFAGLVDTEVCQEYIQVLKGSKQLKKQINQEANLYDQELQFAKKYNRAIQHMTVGLPNDSLYTDRWWHIEINNLHRLTGSKVKEKANMAERVINNITAQCYMAANRFSDEQRYEKADLFSTLWMKMQPENDWAKWNAAKIYARAGKLDHALKLLKILSEKGNMRKEQLLQDPDFAILQNEVEFKEIIKVAK